MNEQTYKSKIMHKVKVHPVETGRPVYSKVKLEKKFETAFEAKCYIDRFNETVLEQAGREIARAVYVGKVDSVTGELL
jgi:hypothetical protein